MRCSPLLLLILCLPVAGSPQRTPAITKNHVVAPPPPPPQSPPPPVPNGSGTSTILYLGVTDLVFEGITGSGTAPSYSFPLHFYNTEQPWTAKAFTIQGGEWLSVTPDKGVDNRTLTVAVSVRNLVAGTYTGTVVVESPDAIDSPKTIPITFRVRDPIATTILLVPNSATFVTYEGAPNPPPPVTILLEQQGEVVLDWSVSSTTFNGGNWLSVSPAAGRDDAPIILRANPANLPQGSYVGRVTITAPKAINNPINLTVVLTVGRGRAATGGEAYNAATSRPGALAPGQLATFYGSRLGPRTPAFGVFNQATKSFPTTLGGTRVLFDGKPVPLLYVSYDQINFQVPFEFSPFLFASLVTVQPQGFDFDTLLISINPTAPGIFTFDGKQAAALNQDNSVNSAQNPADAGSVVQLFLTGQGVTNPAVLTGQPAPSIEPFARPVAPVSVFLDGKPAKVLFAGLAPGTVGLLQINLEIPTAAASASKAEIKVQIGDIVSPAANIAIRSK